MTTYPKAVPGRFCWVELGTSDVGAARKFYTSLFGWTIQDVPMPGGGNYGMAQIGKDKNVAGINVISEEGKKMGARPTWLGYVAVEDADVAAKKIASLGGKVLMGPMKAEPGTMAIANDPSGATFGIWQEHRSMGPFVYGETGASVWNELATSDVDRAGKFYATLFGWKLVPQQMPHMVYTVLQKGDEQIGGMMPGGADLPVAWNVYFAVENADATAKKIASLGGRLLGELLSIPDIGRMGFFSDPQGAMFAILQPTPTAK